MMPEAGAKAPDFSLPDGSGKTLSLKDFRGKRLVIYFYPKDDTSGCTQESCDFRDNMARVRKLGAEVVGVSADPVKSHAKFAVKYDLPFPLLSDPDKVLIKAYGVWQQKTFMGKTYMGIVRSTFLIDERGVIARAWPKVKVSGHVDEVMEALSE